MGNGRTQPGQARFRPRRDRRAGRYGVDCRGRQRSRIAASHGRSDQIGVVDRRPVSALWRSEEHTSELSHGYISYAVFCLKKKKKKHFTFFRKKQYQTIFIDIIITTSI